MARHGAGCLCGQVRIDIEADPLSAKQCWCRLCQYLAAGSATTNVFFRSEAVTLHGEIRWFGSVADSGTMMERGFCPNCGTQLCSRAEVRPHLMVIRAGALDNPSLIAPEVVIWTAAAPDWAHFDPALPQLEGQSPPKS